ncbi:MAG: TRAP transporter large permease [Gammaproteobacteria bacterium]|nr:TRAP transporter large permease [Gammaproteobacteria bacterium]
MTLALAAFAILATLLVLRVPVGIAMLLVGMAGDTALSGAAPVLAYMKTAPFWLYNSYAYSVIPMFLLMGQLASRSGLSGRLFDAASAFLGHRRGGIAMATIGACGAFGAICGSSLATTGTMARVALPELGRHRYSPSLATGAVAAGGTLGILIPPSVVLIVYAVAVEANIVTLFVAAFLPGLLAIAGFLVTIALYVRLAPSAGPAGPRADAACRRKALRETWPTLLLFAIVIGGLYAGWFDPTESAAIGAFGAALLAYWQGGLRLAGFIDSILATAVTTALIFTILLGADFLNIFLTLSGFPETLAALITASGWHPYAILLLLIAIYLLLGCIMDSLAMIFLTIPIFWPIIAGLDFGMPVDDVRIWFGIIALAVVEIGLITPPVGLNVLIIKAESPGTPLRSIYAGTVPFVAAELVRVALLVGFPAICLALPRWLG